MLWPELTAAPTTAADPVNAIPPNQYTINSPGPGRRVRLFTN